MSDVLKIAPWNIVPVIIKILEPNFPESLAMHCSLRQYWIWKTQCDPNLEVYLLTPDGKVDEYGTFVLYIPEHRNSIIFDTLHPDHDRIKQLFITCDIIDWSRKLIFFPMRDEFMSALNEVFDVKKMKRGSPDFCCHAFCLKNELGLKITYECPPEVYMAPPKEEHAELIDSIWPPRGDNSVDMIRFTIRHNSGVGIFLKETNELVSWSLINFYFGPGYLQTVEAHKRKGYGLLATKAITKLVAKKGGHSILFVHNDNVASQNLFLKLGYKKTYPARWCTVVPENYK